MLNIVKITALKPFILAMSVASMAFANGKNVKYTDITVEEKRIVNAFANMPLITKRLNERVDKFNVQLTQAHNYTVLTQLVIRHGAGLWQDAKSSFNQLNDLDDRPLYWARLQMTKALRSAKGFSTLFPNQQQKLLWKFELLSRGQMDVKFDKRASKKILLTGFDPFFLDKHINQSNPSGVAALSLDDLVVSIDGKTAEIEVLIIPVRFADFDQGMIEELLTPYLEEKSIDMLLTISMGRDNFDLERFPALRRSAAAPDNLNIYTGASKTNPLIPTLKETAISGPEFIEFSLPTWAMKKAMGKYQVKDNRKVATLESGIFNGNLLAELNKQTSVSGSGGGYLSNEISYRSLLLRDQLNPTLAVGHIHTPRIKAFDNQALADIVHQTKAIITQGVAAL